MFIFYYHNTNKKKYCEYKINEEDIEKAEKIGTAFISKNLENIGIDYSGQIGILLNKKRKVLRAVYKKGNYISWDIPIEETEEEKKEREQKIKRIQEEAKEKARKENIKKERKRAATKKYLQKFDEIRIRIPKGEKQTIKNKAERKGMSVNAYIKFLIDNDK